MARNPTLMNKTKITLNIPSEITGSHKVEIANRVIEFIRDRTLQGKNVRGKQWGGKAGEYTPEYTKQKGYSSPVDLELSGSMLNSIKQFKSKEGEIKIGYRKGTKNERKAEGNILGKYGQPNPIKGKARPFLDILKKDLDSIITDYTEEIAKQQEKKKAKVKPRELKQTEGKPGEFIFE